jgi:hypothetical protein
MNGYRIGECKDLVRKLEGKRSLDDPSVNGRIILKCTLQGDKGRIGLIWFMIRTDGGFL